MSMPYDVIYCDRCDYSSASYVLWGIFKYRFTDGHETYIDRMLGWCDDCESVQAIERLPVHAQIVLEQDAVCARLRVLNPNGVIGKLALLFSRRRREEAKKLQARAKDLEHIEPALASRSAPARCLECSSKSTRPLPVYSREQKRYDHALEMPHPRCSGTLHVRDSRGNRVALRMKDRIYNSEGELMAIEWAERE